MPKTESYGEQLRKLVKAASRLRQCMLRRLVRRLHLVAYQPAPERPTGSNACSGRGTCTGQCRSTISTLQHS